MEEYGFYPDRCGAEASGSSGGKSRYLPFAFARVKKLCAAIPSLGKTNKAQSYKISHPKLPFCQNINIQWDTQKPGLEKKWFGHTNDDNISKLAKSSTWRLFSVTMLKNRMQ